LLQLFQRNRTLQKHYIMALKREFLPSLTALMTGTLLASAAALSATVTTPAGVRRQRPADFF
jgi:hypothetical protein